MMLLANRYRPQSFDSIVGQSVNKIVLSQMIKRKNVPSGLLFTGAFGSGKTSMARILAAALNCNEETKPCGICLSCKEIFLSVSNDVIEIDAASYGSVAHIRELIENLQYQVSGNFRILLLDECHSISKEGFSALLKTLEEPPERTVFILLTTETHKIPDTILSRLMHFEFKKIGSADIAERLTFISIQDSLNVEEPLIQHLAQRAKGSLRDAIMSMDQVTRIGVTNYEQYKKLTGDYDIAPDLLSHMIDGNINKVFSIIDAQLQVHGDSHAISAQIMAGLRDVLVLAAGGACGALGDALTARVRLSARAGPETLFKATRLCWQLETQVKMQSYRQALDLLCILLTETLSGKKNLAVTVKPESRPITLEEMMDV